MNVATKTEINVQQAVPFFMVANLENSLRHYVDGLGFTMKHKWIDEGHLRWCWLQLEGAALMLQEHHKDRVPKEKPGVGVCIYFICNDALALYHAFVARGVKAQRPFVGNSMWVVGVTDPDGYRLYFESPTDVPEETEYSG